MFQRPVTLGIATAVVALATATGAHAAPSASPTVHVISSCTKATFEPNSYVFFCADAGAGLQKATYAWWTTKTAHGTGVYYHNDCTPNCAAGHVHHGQAEFTLYRVRNTSKYGPLFTQIEVDTRSSHHVFELPTSTV
jgi:hypothetical protein